MSVDRQPFRHVKDPGLEVGAVTRLLLASPPEQNICPSNHANYREPASRDTTQDEVITTPPAGRGTSQLNVTTLNGKTQRYNGTTGQFGTSGAKEYLGLAKVPL